MDRANILTALGDCACMKDVCACARHNHCQELGKGDRCEGESHCQSCNDENPSTTSISGQKMYFYRDTF